MIANLSAQGYRVESQSDFQAVIVKGKKINHALHIMSRYSRLSGSSATSSFSPRAARSAS
jgi:hypothetical protein